MLQSMLKRWWLVVVVVVVMTGLMVHLTSCGQSDVPTLHIFNWADYVNPDVIKQFEEQYKCRVVMDYFESNEMMYAKLKAGATGYDVLFPSSYMGKLLHDQGMVIDLKHDLLPNVKTMSPEMMKIISIDQKMQYSVPYMITMTGIGYNTKKVKDFQATWAMFDRVDLKGKITLLDDHRETLGAALKFLGYSLNTTDEKQLEQARDVVIRWKKNIAKFEVEGAKMKLGSEEFVMVHQYSGDVFQVIDKKPEIEFALPKEGFSISCDDMVIPKDAKYVELAHQFINYLCDPKICAQNMEFVRYAAPNPQALPHLSKEFTESPVYINNLKPCYDVEFMKRGEVIQDVGADLPKYIKVWNEIKAAE